MSRDGGGAVEWFDDDADLGDVDVRSQITVDQLLRREGFRPAGSRARRRKLTGLAWIAVGAMVGAVLWHHPIGTVLASGSATSPAGGADPSAQAAIKEGTTAAIPHANQPPPDAVAPRPPVLVAIPPATSVAATRPRTTPHARPRRLPVVKSAVVHTPAPVITPTAPSFDWFDCGRFGGGQWYWGGYGGWGH